MKNGTAIPWTDRFATAGFFRRGHHGALRPYFLGVNFSSGEITAGLPGGDGAFYFSLAHKRDFPGPVTLCINVADAFPDGTVLNLCYYGGYDGTIYHVASPVIAEYEIQQQDELRVVAGKLSVADGLVSARLRYGGNFFLAPATNEAENEQAADGSAAAVTEPGSAGVFAAEVPLGSIEALFPEASLATAVASKLSKQASDSVTQGDLDGIQSLYLDHAGLSAPDSLTKQTFGHLTSLSLAGNGISAVPLLQMPRLERLDLSGNRISTLENLNNRLPIKHLLLSGNQLASLPDFSGLQVLQTLDLSSNLLSSADGLALPVLLYLDLSGNKLTALPDLTGCPALAEAELWDQRGSYALELEAGTSVFLAPFPELIAQLGGEADVVLSDEKGASRPAPDYDTLKNDGIDPDALGLLPGGTYRLTILGTKDGQTIGTYTYLLAVSGETSAAPPSAENDTETGTPGD
jgi:hypothetical protein